MDVACNRCHAEYEFDDALISERGTTVFCTSCGLQFKIYPADRRGVPEEWTLTPALPGTEARTFRSLRDLQRAILDGEVKETDLLARGGQRPRALGSIAELEPLLKRPRSAPPPPTRTDDVPKGLGAAPAPLRRTAGGTVMGLAAPRVPNFGAPAPPAGSAPPAAFPPTGAAADEAGERESVDVNAIVPSSPEPPGPLGTHAEPWQGAPSQTLRPKIQSVLSRSPAALPPPEPAGGGDPPSSSRLRAMLVNSAPPSTPGGSRVRPSSGAIDGVSDPPASRQSRFDSEPFSVIPGTRPRPRARGAWIVVSVLVGATAFVLTAARERVFALFGGPGREEAAPHLIGAERAAHAAVELADEAWLRVRMATPEGRPARDAALEARLIALEQVLEESAKGGPGARSSAWTVDRIHYLRMKGDVPGARNLLGQAKGAPIADPYLLAMLDLADQSGQRPFASILRRLKDASSGERGRYRMRCAYIVALVEAGQLALAKEDFGRMAQNGDAVSAPLYGDLTRFLEERSKPEPVPTEAPGAELGKAAPASSPDRALEAPRPETPAPEPVRPGPARGEPALPGPAPSEPTGPDAAPSGTAPAGTAPAEEKATP